MLTIRPEQMEVFRKAALQKFEDELVGHLQGFAAKHSELLGDADLRRVIRLGMDRAARYGFTNRGPVRFYVELIFLLGSDFDTDPQLPWAGEVLNDPAITDQMARADQLHGRLTDYRAHVAGPDSAYARAALRRARLEPFEIAPAAGGSFADEVVRRMTRTHPEKCAYMGEVVLRGLVPHGRALARKYAVSTDAGAALFVGLMFALGHGFATDPQHPWIEGTLTNAAVGDPNRRAERLHAKAMTYLDRVLSYLGQG